MTALKVCPTEFEHEWLDEAVRLLIAHPIRQSTDDQVPGHKYWTLGLPGTMFLAHQFWAIWFIVERWVWDTDMPGALMVDEMRLGKTFTSIAAAILCKLVTEKVVMGLPLYILRGNILEERVILAHNDFPGIVGEEWEWYLLQKFNSVACRLLEIQSTPPHGHPALVSTLEPILVVTMPGVAKTFRTVINEMTHGTEFKPVNLFNANNANPTHKDLNSSIDELHNQWNIHLLSYNTFTSRAKPSTHGQLSYCAWSFGIFDESHRYRPRTVWAGKLGWMWKLYSNFSSLLHWDFTLRLVVSDDVAVFRCAWQSGGWYCDGEPWCGDMVVCTEEFDVCYQDRKWRSSTGCGTPNDTDCKALKEEKVVGIETSQLQTTCSDTESKCPTHWSRVQWGRPSKTDDSCGVIHFPGCFSSMKSS